MRPEWLDRIDQLNLPLDHSFTSNRTGAGVTVYDVDTGARIDHPEFGTRASIVDDEVAKAGPPAGAPPEICNWKSTTNNDCDGHGTAMLGLIGGTTYGVAKSATLDSVKVYYPYYPTPTTRSDWTEYAWIVDGINWVTAHHNDHPTQLEVVNCSFEVTPGQADAYDPNPDINAVRNAVKGSLNSGVSYTIAAGNSNQSLDDSQTPRKTPRDVMDLDEGRKGALLVGAENQETDYRLFVQRTDGTVIGSNYGSKLSLFSPGYRVTSANSDPNNLTNINDSTSRASAIAAGVLALYLQGRTGMNDCVSHPIQGTASATTGVAISTCPDRVSQFIRANANICDSAISGCQRINDRGASPDRLLYIGYMPPTDNFNFNPIDNQRFFVWQQYEDFLFDQNPPQPEPNEAGLDWWTNEIIGHGHCNAVGINSNDWCTDPWRTLTSRAFFVAIHPSWFTDNWALSSSTDNTTFVIECYARYLHKNVTSGDSGVQSWVTDLNTYGTPASPNGVLHIITAFLHSGAPDGYRLRFEGS